MLLGTENRPQVGLVFPVFYVTFMVDETVSENSKNTLKSKPNDMLKTHNFLGHNLFLDLEKAVLLPLKTLIKAKAGTDVRKGHSCLLDMSTLSKHTA